MFAFWAEGGADYRFLRRLVERIISQLVPHVDVLSEVVSPGESNLSLEDKYVDIARQCEGYALLIVHLDADRPTEDHALTHRFNPGLTRIQAELSDDIPHIVPVIPIRHTEAWMLVDFDAFSSTVSNKYTPQALGFPVTVSQLESLNAEQLLKKALGTARSSRRSLTPDDLYEPLAAKLDISNLKALSAYQAFVTRLRTALMVLHLLSDE